MLNIVDILLFTVLYFGIAFSSYLLAPKITSSDKDKKKDNHLYYSWFPSGVHALTSSILVLIKICTEKRDFNGNASDLTKIIAEQSIGYFIHDSIKSEIFHLNDSLMRLHHIFALIGLTSGLMNNYGSHEIAYGLFLAEISNVFFVMRGIMRHLNLKSNKFYLTSEILFAVIFISIRSLIGPIYNTLVFSDAKIPMISKLFGCCLNFLSTIWIAEILCTIGMKLTSNKSDKFALFYRKVAEGLRKSKKNKAIYYGTLIIPQIAFSIVNHINSH